MIPHTTLEIFSTLWWQTNIIVISIIFFLLIIGKKYKHNPILTYTIGSILIIRTIGIHFYWLYLNIWTIESSLPLHLCGLSAILSGIVLFWRNQLAYEFLYYWGISGAFHALITPEFTSGNTGLLFLEYYISHGGIILSALYLTLVLDMKPRKGSWFQVFLLTQLILPFIGLINWMINANYMYMCIKPIANNPLLWGEWPWYFIGIEFIGFIHFFLIYLPFGYKYYFYSNDESPKII